MDFRHKSEVAMTDKELAEYSHLWGADVKNYVIFSLEPNGTDLGRCMIIDRQNKSIKLIENRELVPKQALPERGFAA